VHDRVGEHLGVDAKIPLVVERPGRRLRDGADAQLERGAVRDQRGDVLADAPLNLANGLLGIRVGRDVDLDRAIDL
jgi:hypothetical protein